MIYSTTPVSYLKISPYNFIMRMLSHGLRYTLASFTSLSLPLLVHAAAAPIVGGNPVPHFDKAPYVAQFVRESAGEVWCGGTVINESWILTAGHCKSVAKQYPLYVGTLGVGAQAPGAIKLEAAQLFVHPKYKSTSSSVHYDFMLVRLKQPIDLQKTGVVPATLPSPDFISRGLQDPGTMATTMGWGALEEEGESSNELMEVDVPIIEASDAKKAYPNYDQSMIAAGYATGGKDSCQGDSGGPLIVVDPKNQAPTLIGVVSFGEGCARPDYYGVYARVSEALDWIDETIQDNP